MRDGKGFKRFKNKHESKRCHVYICILGRYVTITTTMPMYIMVIMPFVDYIWFINKQAIAKIDRSQQTCKLTYHLNLSLRTAIRLLCGIRYFISNIKITDSIRTNGAADDKQRPNSGCFIVWYGSPVHQRKLDDVQPHVRPAQHPWTTNHTTQLLWTGKVD